MNRKPVQVIFTLPDAPSAQPITDVSREASSPPPPASPSKPRDRRLPSLSSASRNRLGLFAFPPLIYMLCYFALTYPNILSWRTRFFCDSADGLDNVWNLWWVNQAITVLHTSPWFTTYLHFPHGTSLLGHTLNPLNGFLCIPLLSVFSLAVSHNLIEVFCFAASGTTAFWLARKVTDSYWPSVIAGYAFTFSAYHWSHAAGHMQLTAMQWIPLFLLAWICLLERPGVWLALGAAAALGAVELCDFYYLFYCILAGIILVIAEMVHRRQPLFFRQKNYLIGFGAFVGFALLLCAPLPIAVVRLNSADPLQGAHPPDLFYTDLLAPLIPSQMWRWNALTQGYWSHLFPSPAELCVSLGVAIIAAASYAIFNASFSNGPQQKRLWTWLTLGILFFILSLGRRLHVCGKDLTGPIMPYRWLEAIVPPVRLSGCPSRMMVMTTLAACILAAMGVRTFAFTHRRLIWPVGSLFLLLMIVESIPVPMPTMPAIAPEWASRLEKMPGTDAGVMFVNCQSQTASEQLFAQITFQKPIAYQDPMGDGYIARIPLSDFQNDVYNVSLLQQHRLADLYHQQKVRYIVTDGAEPPAAYGIVYEGSNRRIYDLSAMLR